jgi:hypothetical protein
MLLLALSAFGQSTVSQVLTSTCQTNVNNPCSGSQTVQATSATTYLNSQGILFDPSVSYYGFEKINTIILGIHHVRSGAITSTYIANVKDMAASGILTQYVASTDRNPAIDTTLYWSATGQITSLFTFLTSSFGPTVQSFVDVIEAPNELDAEYNQTYWLPSDYPSTTLCATNSCGKWYGQFGINYQQSLWAILKGNSQTSTVKILGPSIATAFPSPFAVAAGGGGADLQGYADFGGCHPYATAGNGYGVPQTTYDNTSYYLGYTLLPSSQVDFAPFAWQQCNSSTTDGAPTGTVYGTTPLAPSEQGFYTGTANNSVPEDTHAKYYPRIYAEMYRHGMPRSITFRFDDQCSDLTNPQCNWGLMRFDKTLKPAYYAMKSLNTLLLDPGGAFSPGTLTYSVSVSANGAFTRTQYMHDLLLEKSNGEFYLLFWHEIADVKKQEDDGSQIVGTAHYLFPLSLPVTITLPNTIGHATLYTYDSNWNMQPTALTITSHQVSLTATDEISVLRLGT